MNKKDDTLQRLVFRTLGHFITPRLRLYLARLLFTSANKPINKGVETANMDKKMMVLICDCFSDPAFLEYLRSQAVLLRVQILNEHMHTIITLPEEQRVVYDAIAHMCKAGGIPLMVASPFEQSSLWLSEGQVKLD
jgi:hypothetical protein